MDGSSQSQDDVAALAAMGDNLPSADLHPNLFGWFFFVSKFDARIRASWPHGAGLPASCTQKVEKPKKQAAKQVAQAPQIQGGAQKKPQAVSSGSGPTPAT